MDWIPKYKWDEGWEEKMITLYTWQI